MLMKVCIKGYDHYLHKPTEDVLEATPKGNEFSTEELELLKVLVSKEYGYVCWTFNSMEKLC